MRRVIFFFLLILLNSTVWAAAISLDQREAKFVPGDPINIDYFDAEDLQSGAWVGVYKSGFLSNSEHIAYQYLAGDSGTLVFSAPKEYGEYEVVLFDSGYEGKEHARVKFSVSAINTDKVSLTTDRASYKPASSIKVNLVLYEKFSAEAWVGIFPKKVPHGIVDNYMTYKTVKGDKEQSYIFVAPEEPGDYEFRFFDDSYGNEIAYVPFVVDGFDNQNLSLNTDKKIYKPQETVKVHFLADKDFPRDAWIGLYEGKVKEASKNTDSYLDYRYIEKKIESDMSFKAPAVKGDYHFKMVSSYNGAAVAMTDIAVDRSIDSGYLKEKIDKDGRVVLYGIYFDLDKSEIKPASLPTLQVVGELLDKYPDLSLKIEGHTDNQGEASYNKQLSEKRAQAVERHLVKSFSIASNRLKAIGFGEERPLNDNVSEAEQALNRRVEIVKMNPDNAEVASARLSGVYSVDIVGFKSELEKNVAKSLPTYRFHEDMRVEIIVNGSPAYEGSYLIDQSDKNRLIIKFEGRTLEAKLSKDQSQFYLIEGEQTPYIKAMID
jgi:outer membrane protein OmpA-like peptidoglycan-associated protein